MALLKVIPITEPEVRPEHCLVCFKMKISSHIAIVKKSKQAIKPQLLDIVGNSPTGIQMGNNILSSGKHCFRISKKTFVFWGEVHHSTRQKVSRKSGQATWKRQD